MKRFGVLLAMSGALLLSAGCIKGLDWKSGGDHVREKAKKLKLDDPVCDSLSTYEGDHNDWYMFSLKKKGAVTIVVAFDNWKNIQAKIYLRNAFGGVLHKHTWDDKEQLREIGPFLLAKGEYFVQMSASWGASVYTLHVKYKPYEAGDSNIKVPRPE